jgi:23S rRNA pseudouridine2605 synthase
MPEERLQKVLAAAGVASRRASEALITAGRVQVDGKTVTELGTKVDPATAKITVDGKPVRLPEEFVYVKVHKPQGILSDIGGDTQGRSTVADLLPPDIGRVFPVGRLDLLSEGLVLLTNDGELAHKLTHPRFEHPKTYFVLVNRMPSAAELDTLRSGGIELPDGNRTAPADVRVVSELPKELTLAPGPKRGVWLRFVLREGKKRQIRHMIAAVGLSTQRLVRWAIGSLVLGAVKPGEYKMLTRGEVSSLRTMVSHAKPGKPGSQKGAGRGTTKTGRPSRSSRRRRDKSDRR